MNRRMMSQRSPTSEPGRVRSGLVLLCMIISACGSDGVLLTIQNGGEAPLEDTVVHVTGNVYSLGDVEPGSQATLRLRVTGDSHVRIESSSGEPIVLDVYLQREEPGRIWAIVTPDSVVSVEHSRGRWRRY
jgi:hypothetical protein